MGISGLLPALKQIQVVKPLEDYKGKKVAVDAYVWLHKGVYACATELATGKATSKYVDYAMHRVRLLRHYGIEPYIVFDGGPLPAKRGTEEERKKRREEYLGRGHALAAQGKHSQARECYIKCVDVTPQMAYQLIKALKAESVPYVVAPYEADAQLAYLERAGLVDAILTEDSDLLVFGCKNVLFKLDTTANTVVSISRSDFSSICDSTVGGMSFLGWSDVQFRAMAILSGCDYLPSIPGIGLKRACSMLRKWKTVEQVVRAITLEGKLKVPPGYIDKFRLAEKCYLHQRVYCPLEDRLVHLTEVDVNWDHESDAYVGGDLDPKLARAIAKGEVDPVTLLPIKDINPGFKPNALKPIPGFVNSSPRKVKGKEKGKEKEKGKGKAAEKPTTGGILNFFGPNPTIPPRSRSNTTNSPAAFTVGKASGKRTLADVMDHDITERHKRLKKRDSLPPMLTESKFFADFKPTTTPSGRRKTLDSFPVASSSGHSKGKENAVVVISSDSEEEELSIISNAPSCNQVSEPDATDLSIVAQYPAEDCDQYLEEPAEPVEQEDGYISPAPSYCLDAQDLSSPPREGSTPLRRRRGHLENYTDDDIEADILSSPMSAVKLRKSPFRKARYSQSPTPTNRAERAGMQPPVYAGPDLLDLENNISNDLGDEIFAECLTGTSVIQSRRVWTKMVSGSTAPPTPSPETPDDTVCTVPLVIDVDEVSDYEDQATHTQTFINGWRAKWALNRSGSKESATSGIPGGIKRSETNITPLGRHSLGRKAVTLQSAPVKRGQNFKHKNTHPPNNNTLALFGEPGKTDTQNSKILCDLSGSDIEDPTEPLTDAEEYSEQLIVSRTQQSLTKFRYARVST